MEQQLPGLEQLPADMIREIASKDPVAFNTIARLNRRYNESIRQISEQMRKKYQHARMYEYQSSLYADEIMDLDNDDQEFSHEIKLSLLSQGFRPKIYDMIKVHYIDEKAPGTCQYYIYMVLASIYYKLDMDDLDYNMPFPINDPNIPSPFYWKDLLPDSMIYFDDDWFNPPEMNIKIVNRDIYGGNKWEGYVIINNEKYELSGYLDRNITEENFNKHYFGFFIVYGYDQSTGKSDVIKIYEAPASDMRKIDQMLRLM